MDLVKECGLPKREVIVPEENVELHKKIDDIIKNDYVSLNEILSE